MTTNKKVAGSSPAERATNPKVVCMESRRLSLRPQVSLQTLKTGSGGIQIRSGDTMILRQFSRAVTNRQRRKRSCGTQVVSDNWSGPNYSPEVGKGAEVLSDRGNLGPQNTLVAVAPGPQSRSLRRRAFAAQVVAKPRASLPKSGHERTGQVHCNTEAQLQ